MAGMRGAAWFILSLLASSVSDRKLHDRAIVIDAHSDCTQRIAYDGIDFARAQPDMHVDLPKMRAGGLDAQFFSIFVGPWQAKPEGYYAERSEEHTSELQSPCNLVCRLLLEKKKRRRT